MRPSIHRIETWIIIVMQLVALALVILIVFTFGAKAQGLYIGRDGRAHPQVIVGADGGVFPVIPTYCQHGWGPCPVFLGNPLPPLPVMPRPAEAYAPPPPPPPLGWIYRTLAPCGDSTCSVVVVSVGADGANIRAVPNGPVTLAVANGVPLTPLQRDGNWLLVAPACPLSPTFTASVTAGGVPLSVCL